MANKKNSYDSKPAIANKFLNPNGTTSTLDEIITEIVPGTTPVESTGTAAKEYQSKPAVANKFLNTDGTYSTLDEILGRTIGGITQFDVEVVEELPEVGEKGILYLVPNEGSGGNVYDEYIWVPSTESFEKIGTTEIDLSGYEQLINKVTSIDDQSTDTQYPSAKLLYDQLGLKLNGKKLVGTSYQYICNKSTDNNYLYSASASAFGEKLKDGVYEVMGLKYTASGSDNIQAPPVDCGQSILYYVSQQRKVAIPLQLDDQGDGHFPATLSNGVLYQSVIQSKYNKVTSISSSSTDDQYPSAKLLYDQLATKVKKAGDTMTGTLSVPNVQLGSIAIPEQTGNNTISVGAIQRVSGNNSVAIGTDADIRSNNALGAGYAATVSGDNAFAHGYASTAGRNSATASGYYVSAQGYAQTVEGMYNVVDSSGTASSRGTYAHIVGNGTGTSSADRSNAHTLDWSGNAWFAGDVYVGSTGGKNKDAGSIKLAKDVVFTGTDGTSAGTSGLVPNPTVGDVDKYLKADGTWASVPNPSNITQQEIISLFS